MTPHEFDHVSTIYVALGRALGQKMVQVMRQGDEIHNHNDPVLAAQKALIKEIKEEVIDTALRLSSFNVKAVRWIVNGAFNEEIGKNAQVAPTKMV